MHCTRYQRQPLLRLVQVFRQNAAGVLQAVGMTDAQTRAKSSGGPLERARRRAGDT
jgi:hypothetical protein